MSKLSKSIVPLLFVCVFVSACGSGLDVEAQAEAMVLTQDAEKAYSSGARKMQAILEGGFRDSLDTVKAKKPDFEKAVVDLTTAKEKFELATSKYGKSFNGGKAEDSPTHKSIARDRDYYKKSAEAADIMVQIARAGANVTDLDAFKNLIKGMKLKSDKLSMEMKEMGFNSR